MDVTNKYNTDGTSDFDNGVTTNCNNVIISDLNNDVTKKAQYSCNYQFDNGETTTYKTDIKDDFDNDLTPKSNTDNKLIRKLCK